MHTFLCRLMIAVFLLNCVLPGAWAEPVRTGKKKKTTVADMEKTVARAATQAAQSKTPYQNWQAAQAELEAVLKEPDLTPQEKQFAQLELQIVNTHMEFIDRLDSFNATQLNRAYGQRLEQLKNREEDLEKQNALRDFYQSARSNWGVAAAVYALHKHADQARRQNALQDQAWNETDQVSKQLHAQTKLQPSTLRVAPPTPARLDTRGNDEVLKRWADNKLSLEELVEYADPILLAPNTPLNNSTISDGAELLAILLNSYSAQRAQLDKETLARISWLAQRAKYRALHRLDVLQQQINIHPQTASTMMQARGNLVLLAKEADKFTKMSEPAPSAQEDTKLASYKLVKEELAAYNPQSEGISTAKFAHEIVAQIKKDYQGHPSQDDAQFELLARNLSYTVQYLLAIGNTNLLLDLMVLINEDGADIHGYNEVFVGSVFATLFDSMINQPLSKQTQNTVQQLLLCAAAPSCTYDNTRKTNAVNVRVQALAVGSMLRQVAQKGKMTTDNFFETEVADYALEKSLFNDLNFRRRMAAYAVDIYAPTQKWNVRDNDVKKYGLNLDELQKFAHYMASIFETFLPVPEPNDVFKVVKEGMYEGCLTREIDTKRLTYLNNLNATRNGSISQQWSKHGYRCNENPGLRQHGGPNNLVVFDSNGRVQGISAISDYNRDRAVQDFANNFMTEVLTWYLWGGAFKVLKYMRKGARAALAATRAAGKAPSGIRGARFQSKFAQVWKYGNNGWQTEMGLVSVQKKGNTISVEMHRPGYERYSFEISEEALQGHSLKSLKGRILLRRALQRKIYMKYGAGAQRAAAAQQARATGKAPTFEATNNEARKLSTPLSKAEQKQVYRVEKPKVDAVKSGFQKDEFEAISSEDGRATLYQPKQQPDPLVDLSTGLPEEVVLDPVTGNVTGKVSHQYAGTVVPTHAQEDVAYKIAAGLTNPSAQFTARYIAYQFPVLQQLKGLSKFVFTLTALDYPAYYFYTKPQMQKFGKEQEEALSKSFGYDTQKAQQEAKTANQGQNVLEQIQALRSDQDDTVGAFIQFALMGANQVLNTFLPAPIQNFRRGLFNLTTDVMKVTDEPLERGLQSTGLHLNEFFPLPGQVITMPLLLGPADTTAPFQINTNPLENAAALQYQQGAHTQQLTKALEMHNINEFKQNITKVLEELEKNRVQYMDSVAQYLQALPTGTKEMKTAYQVYTQQLKAAQEQADKDLDNAGKLRTQADEKFMNTQADILRRSIHASLQAQKSQEIPTYINQYKQYFGYLFTPQEEKSLTKVLTDYFKQHEQLLIAFYTAPQKALQTGQDPIALQDAANLALSHLNLQTSVQLNSMQARLNAQGQQMMLWQQAQMFLGEKTNAFLDDMGRMLNGLYDPEVYDPLARVLMQYHGQLQEEIENAKNENEFESIYQRVIKQRDEEFAKTKQALIDQGYGEIFERAAQNAAKERFLEEKINAFKDDKRYMLNGLYGSEMYEPLKDVFNRAFDQLREEIQNAEDESEFESIYQRVIKQRDEEFDKTEQTLINQGYGNAFERAAQNAADGELPQETTQSAESDIY